MGDRDTTADLVIVGSGAAGLMAACVAGEAVPSSTLLTDSSLGRSNSVMAQGGLHVPIDSPTSRDGMLHDMVRAGGSSVDLELAARFVSEINPTVEALIDWGLDLDRDDGHLVRRLAGAMSEPRIVGTGDRIGPAVIRALRNRLDSTSINIKPHSRVVQLFPVGSGLELVLEDESRLSARAVILATGGDTFRHAQLTRQPCTNPANRNSEMSDALTRLGLPRVDDGLYQWQPFGLLEVSERANPTAKPCVPESVVGRGARIVDRSGAEVVSATAGRAKVTAAMKTAIDGGRGITLPSGARGLRLTLSEVPDETIRSEYGHLASILDRHGLFGEDVVIAPYLHYQLGGFRIGQDCSCDIPGLFLAGEMTGGIHGHGRLMGNGLTDSLVHGRRAAASAIDFLRGAGQAPDSRSGLGQ